MNRKSMERCESKAPDFYFGGFNMNGNQKFDEQLTDEEATEIILSVEEAINIIKNGEMEGEYFEF